MFSWWNNLANHIINYPTLISYVGFFLINQILTGIFLKKFIYNLFINYKKIFYKPKTTFVYFELELNKLKLNKNLTHSFIFNTLESTLIIDFAWITEFIIITDQNKIFVFMEINSFGYLYNWKSELFFSDLNEEQAMLHMAKNLSIVTGLLYVLDPSKLNENDTSLSFSSPKIYEKFRKFYMSYIIKSKK